MGRVVEDIEFSREAMLDFGREHCWWN
jgi:hypothetical protein